MATSRKTPAKSATKAKAKPATAKVPATPKVAVATAATPPATTVVEAVKPVVTGEQIKKPELIDRVVAESGMKKKDVKPVVEAMLAVLGRALVSGEELNVPPLGKVMINRVKEVSNATVLNIKVRHPKQDGSTQKQPLAEAAE